MLNKTEIILVTQIYSLTPSGPFDVARTIFEYLSTLIVHIYDMCTTLSGTIRIEWFDVIVTIVTGYLGDRRLVVPLILPRTCVRLDPGYTCTCTLHYMYMPARRPRARSWRPGLARVDAFSWSQDLAARMRSLGPRPYACTTPNNA